MQSRRHLEAAPSSPVQPPSVATVKQFAPVIAWLCALTVYYAFVVSSGTFKVTAWNSNYYDLLVEGWKAGHLYLPVVPNPLLLAQPDPYDLVNRVWWLWDASLYRGHFYLNWGPAPGMCLWLYKLVTQQHATVHDQWLVLFFALLRLYAGSALIVAYARSQAPALPNWALQLAVLVFGLASPTPYVLARPLMYEAAITSGQAFLFCGLGCAFWGLKKPHLRTRLFVLAGVCFSLAVGSRATMALVAPIVVVVTALVAHRTAGYPPREVLRSLLKLGLPLCMTVVAYGLYNQLRFDSPTEFGLSYILSAPRFVTASRWILPNIVSYLTSDVAWTCDFPFARLPLQRSLTTLITWPIDYNLGNYPMGERAAGVLVASSICWLWGVWFWRAAASVMERITPVRARTWSNDELWLLGCSIALVCGILPATTMWMATMRFLEDACGGILLGSIGAGFWLLTRMRRRTTRLFWKCAYAGLAVYSIGVGVCLGFTGHIENFGRQNPVLFTTLAQRVSVCTATNVRLP